jgi:hypothetical protein
MKNPLIQKSILKILSRLPDVYLREETLAAEVEIAIDRPLKTTEFADELLELKRLELVESDASLLGDPMWHITGKGQLAVQEGVR